MTTLLCAQVEPTTQEEYNYVTKGYKIQIESGLDMKKGYSIKPIDASVSGIITTSNGFKTEVSEAQLQSSALYRDGEAKPCALIVTYFNRKRNFLEHLCIPSLDAHQTLWDAHFMRVKEFSNDAKALIYECVAKASAYFVKN